MINEDAIKDSYEQFLGTGYTGSLEQFKELLATNPAAVKDAFSMFVDTGYNGSVEDFSGLMGLAAAEEEVKKKSEDDGELSSEDGSLDSQESPEIVDPSEAPEMVENDLRIKTEEDRLKREQNSIDALENQDLSQFDNVDFSIDQNYKGDDEGRDSQGMYDDRAEKPQEVLDKEQEEFKINREINRVATEEQQKKEGSETSKKEEERAAFTATQEFAESTAFIDGEFLEEKEERVAEQ